MTPYRQEDIEWTHTWREGSPDETTPRVLLLGDSICVGYRHYVEEKLGGRYHVSSLATSKALDNPYFPDEIRLLAQQETVPYSIVHFNNGAHGGHLDAAQYGRLYEGFYLQLRQLFPEARFVLALTTPMADPADLTQPHPTFEQMSRERNEQVLAVAAKYGLAVDDLYTAVCRRPELHIADGIHFTEEGYQLLADTVADCLLRL